MRQYILNMHYSQLNKIKCILRIQIYLFKLLHLLSLYMCSRVTLKFYKVNLILFIEMFLVVGYLCTYELQVYFYICSPLNYSDSLLLQYHQYYFVISDIRKFEKHQIVICNNGNFFLIVNKYNTFLNNTFSIHIVSMDAHIIYILKTNIDKNEQ